ncbi:MAG TPA: hypothetical protein PLA71_00810 [Saccharofermentans sp.]|mgnify:CR=1 FL=1|nr:hypothetical protein [Saccharofermentans sp.]
MKFEKRISKLLEMAHPYEVMTTSSTIPGVNDIFKVLVQGGLSNEAAEPINVDPKELAMGIRVEMEHVTKGVNPQLEEALAKKIAMDHLAEIPDYYTRLDKMEKEAEAEGKMK